MPVARLVKYWLPAVLCTLVWPKSGVRRRVIVTNVPFGAEEITRVPADRMDSKIAALRHEE